MQTPTHVAIIPDGNRRWAKSRGRPSFEGHRYAAETVLPALIEKASDMGIPYFTFWALSTENLVKRSPDEIHNLFRLLRLYITNRLKDLHKKGVKIMVIGNMLPLPADLKESIDNAVQETAANTKITFTLAINYGGRDEVVRAVHKIMKEEIPSKNVTRQTISSHLDTHDIPDPDLIIRTGGEKRVSGFMLWQSEYAEYAFLDQMFPDVTPPDLEQCIAEFVSRQRRFGK